MARSSTDRALATRMRATAAFRFAVAAIGGVLTFLILREQRAASPEPEPTQALDLQLPEGWLTLEIPVVPGIEPERPLRSGDWAVVHVASRDPESGAEGLITTLEDVCVVSLSWSHEPKLLTEEDLDAMAPRKATVAMTSKQRGYLSLWENKGSLAVVGSGGHASPIDAYSSLPCTDPRDRLRDVHRWFDGGPVRGLDGRRPPVDGRN